MPELLHEMALILHIINIVHKFELIGLTEPDKTAISGGSVSNAGKGFLDFLS